LIEAVQSPRCFSIAGRTSLRELIVAYGLAEVLVTNDSGPAHFAGVAPIDVVTLFGPETPELFGARSPRNHIFWAGLACSPCVSALNNRVSTCQDNVCMQRIEVDAVFQRVCEILAARGHRGADASAGDGNGAATVSSSVAESV
jgi:ADP-heptose:LPS heptosyltransferase